MPGRVVEGRLGPRRSGVCVGAGPSVDEGFRVGGQLEAGLEAEDDAVVVGVKVEADGLPRGAASPLSSRRPGTCSCRPEPEQAELLYRRCWCRGSMTTRPGFRSSTWPAGPDVVHRSVTPVQARRRRGPVPGGFVKHSQERPRRGECDVTNHSLGGPYPTGDFSRQVWSSGPSTFTCSPLRRWVAGGVHEDDPEWSDGCRSRRACGGLRAIRSHGRELRSTKDRQYQQLGAWSAVGLSGFRMVSSCNGSLGAEEFHHDHQGFDLQHRDWVPRHQRPSREGHEICPRSQISGHSSMTRMSCAPRHR